MPTEAYEDYRLRLCEALVLLRFALEKKQAPVVAACSKGSVVLAAAAMERYLNDALRRLCSNTKVSQWNELSSGHRLYIAKQMARRLGDTISGIAAGDELPEERKLSSLKRIVGDCAAAFEDPSTWQHHAEFGLFRHGAGAAIRIHALLKQFSAESRDPYLQLDSIGWDRGTFLRAIEQLVDARHAAAHALPEGITPGPKDAQAWIVLSFWLVRRLDKFFQGELA